MQFHHKKNEKIGKKKAIVVDYVSNLICAKIMLHMIICLVRLTTFPLKCLNFGLLITIFLPKIDWFLHSSRARFFPDGHKTPKLWIKLTNTQAFHWEMSVVNVVLWKGI
jgi:hypothetical protein